MRQQNYTTERLLLKASTPRLAAAVAAFYARNREFFRPIDPVREPTFYLPAFQRKVLQHDIRAARQLRALRWWLLMRDAVDNEVIGEVGLGNICFGHFGSAYITYKLDAAYTGQGLMTEALQQVLGVAFGRLGLHRLEANIMPSNVRSLHLAEKLGFENEGLARRYLNINGVWQDHVHMVKLNEVGLSSVFYP